MGAGHRAPLPSKKEVPLEKGGDVSGWLLLTAPPPLQPHVERLLILLAEYMPYF